MRPRGYSDDVSPTENLAEATSCAILRNAVRFPPPLLPSCCLHAARLPADSPLPKLLQISCFFASPRDDCSLLQLTSSRFPQKQARIFLEVL